MTDISGVLARHSLPRVERRIRTPGQLEQFYVLYHEGDKTMVVSLATREQADALKQKLDSASNTWLNWAIKPKPRNQLWTDCVSVDRESRTLDHHLRHAAV